MKKNTFSRKRFLQIAGFSAATIGLASCTEINSIPPDPPPELDLGPDPNPDDDAVYVGAGDTGILNLFYSMAQLEAAFYSQIIDQPYLNIPEEEAQLFQDIHQHEVAHRDFYEAYLAENGIQPLNFDFNSIDFSDRESILDHAIHLEDISVSIYNGFPGAIQRNDYVAMIAKIASVQGRHAAALRLLKQPLSPYFIDPAIINANGLDVFNNPKNFSELVTPYLVENLDISEVPNK